MPKKLITVDYKNKNAILNCSPDLLKVIREKFSIINPNYMSRKFQPRKYAITPSGTFQIGIWFEILSFINKQNLDIELRLTDEFKKNFNPSYEINKISSIEGFNYFDYQLGTIEECLKHGRGLALLATNAGKSLVMAGLCKTILDHDPAHKFLIIVPNTSLLNQLKKSFEYEFGLDSVGMWGDEKVPTWTESIIIANTQTLVSDISFTVKKLGNVNTVLIDEAHILGDKTNKINKVVHNINTPHKFGFTGTLPECLYKSWNVLGKTGAILFEKNSWELRRDNVSTEIEIKVVVCKHKSKPEQPDKNDPSPTKFYDKELEFIMFNDERNNLICKLASKLDGNTLILVDRKAYGQLLLEKLKSLTNKKIFFVEGDTETDEREYIKELMENSNDVICIGMSKIFSTGISIKNLHYAIFAYIGKSNIKVIQTIGRLLRKHENKEKAYIFDIADQLSYSREHLRKRLKFYKEERIKFSITNKDL